MIQSIITIFKKELKDGLRDRRSITSAIAFIVILPVILATGLEFGGRVENELPVVHVKNARAAPSLMAYLKSQGYRLKITEMDLGQAIQADEIELALRIDPDFGESIARGKPAQIEVLVDGSQYAKEAARLISIVHEYGREIVALRMAVRGVSSELMQAVHVRKLDFSTPAARSSQLLGGLLIYLLMTPFIAGMSVAIDILAGERERRSLELLMVQPVSLFALATGKWLTTVAFGLGGLALAMIILGVVLSSADLRSLGLVVSLSPTTWVLMFSLMAPVALLAASLQSLLSLFARSYKEAQLYMSMLLGFPVGAVIVIDVLDFLGFGSTPWSRVIPVVAQHAPLTTLLRGESLDPITVALATASTIIIALGVLWTASRLLRREGGVLA